MTRVLQDIWHGLWTGFGVELSVMCIWLGIKATHSKLAHRLHDEHWFHKIKEYIDG